MKIGALGGEGERVKNLTDIKDIAPQWQDPPNSLFFNIN